MCIGKREREGERCRCDFKRRLMDRTREPYPRAQLSKHLAAAPPPISIISWGADALRVYLRYVYARAYVHTGRAWLASTGEVPTALLNDNLIGFLNCPSGEELESRDERASNSRLFCLPFFSSLLSWRREVFQDERERGNYRVGPYVCTEGL